MKKLILSIIVLTSLITLCGCSKANNDSNENNTNESSVEKADSTCAFKSKNMISKSEKSRFNCEANSKCEWKILGGQMETIYACCPKDLKGKENDKNFDRCFTMVD